MRNPKRTVVLAAVSIAAMIGATTLYAQDAREPAGSMMRGGMMGGASMMGRMDQMMKHCSTMMQGGSHEDRPNDQWRKGSPNKPEKDG